MHWFKKLTLVAAIAIGITCAYFAENIQGHFRYLHLCESEGGLRVYMPLERGVGWLGPSKHMLALAHMKDVAFMRYLESGRLFDMRYRAGPPGDERSYEVVPADEDIPAVYELRRVDERLPGELRTSRSGYEVRELASGRLMLRWHQIGFSAFDRDRTLLAAPSGTACHPASELFAQENQAKLFKPN